MKPIEQKCQSCAAPLDIKGSSSAVVRCSFCNTDNILSQVVRIVVAEDTQQFRVKLLLTLRAKFSMTDLGDVVAVLSGELPVIHMITLDSLAGQTINDKSRELVDWCYRRGFIQKLVNAIVFLRPDIEI